MVCAIYARVSTTEQKDSIENQIAIIESYCNKHNYTYDPPFIDTKSGTGFNQRKAFLQLLKLEGIDWVQQYECFSLNKKVKPKYNKIICKSSSRFGRNLDCIKVLQLLTRQEVQVIFIEDGQEVTNMLDPSTNLVSSINAVVNANFSIQNSQRVKAGMLEGSRAGNVLTTNNIFGYNYNKNTKQLEIIEEQAEVIKFIFKSYLEGKGYNKIAKAVNDKGYRTKRGKEFKPELIGYILQNEKYAGLNVRNKYTRSKIQGDTRAKLKDKSEWIITENIPNIISIDTFNKVQELRLSKKSPNRNKYRGLTPLAGKIKCMKCGHNYDMNYYQNKGKDRVYYYVCWGKKFKSSKYCDNKNLYVHTILQLIDDNFINTLVFKNKKLRMNSLATKINEVNTMRNDYTIQYKEQLRSGLRRLEGRKSKLLDALIDEKITQEDYEFKMNEINKEIQNINNTINQNESGVDERLFKLKKLHNKISKIQINKKYTEEQILNMIQQIKVLDNKLTVSIVIDGITFTEELEY